MKLSLSLSLCLLSLGNTISGNGVMGTENISVLVDDEQGEVKQEALEHEINAKMNMDNTAIEYASKNIFNTSQDDEVAWEDGKRILKNSKTTKAPRATYTENPSSNSKEKILTESPTQKLTPYEKKTTEDINKLLKDKHYSEILLNMTSAEGSAHDDIGSANSLSAQTTSSSETTVSEGNCDVVRVEILTDNYPAETSWQITDATSNTILSGINYEDRSTMYSDEVCVDDWTILSFTINDSYGDGICCSQGSGSYTVTVNDNVVLTGGDFTFTETKPLYCLYGEETINGELVCRCAPDEVRFSINLNTDNFPQETKWTISTCDGDEILQGSYASKNTEYNNSYCIAGDQAYTFEITDTYGDGICCGYGEGNYALFVDRIEVFTSGGAFGSSEVTQVNGDCTAPSSSPSIGTIETSVPSSSSGKPSLSPSSSPSLEKSSLPSNSPSSGPSDIPPMISNSDKPSLSPSSVPSEAPSDFSSDKPSSNPSSGPSEAQLITQIFVDQPDVEYGGSASLINCLGTNTTMIRKLEDTGYVTFTVDLQCLDVEVEVSYVSANNRNMHVFVNDNVDQSFVFNDTGEWCNQGGTSSSIMLPDLSGLKVGLNTFTFQNPSGTPPPVLEWIKFKEGCSFNSESPSEAPSILPSVKTMIPSNYPTEVPTGVPSIVPSLLPSSSVSIQPSSEPSWTPSLSSEPSTISSKSPSSLPSSEPSMVASNTPSSLPSTVPSINPSEKISDAPSNVPISEPSLGPSSFWSSNPSLLPSLEPSSLPSESSESPSSDPSALPSDFPTKSSESPSLDPSALPSELPSMSSESPSSDPSAVPSDLPSMSSESPSLDPSALPSDLPTYSSEPPSAVPSELPSMSSKSPSSDPSALPSDLPSMSSESPSLDPSALPSDLPTYSSELPSAVPSELPSMSSKSPSSDPSALPSDLPSMSSESPSLDPSALPSDLPTYSSEPPSAVPSDLPSMSSKSPSSDPSAVPSDLPSMSSESPSLDPSALPSDLPTYSSEPPSAVPSDLPSMSSKSPSSDPSALPSDLPSMSSESPSLDPSALPSDLPTYSSGPPLAVPSDLPSMSSKSPSSDPSAVPSDLPSMSSESPSLDPSALPSDLPTYSSEPPSAVPSELPSMSSKSPSSDPSAVPSDLPSMSSESPSLDPSALPSDLPTYSSGPPSAVPSDLPSMSSKSPSSDPSALPSDLPTYSSEKPSIRPSAQPSNTPSEEEGCDVVRVEILTDNYPAETSWQITDNTSNMIFFRENYEDRSTMYSDEVCVDDWTILSFTINDSYGDGICCSQGSGSYTVTVNDNVVLTGGDFTFTETKPLYCLYGEETINGELVCRCAPDEVRFSINLNTDNFPQETKWTISTCDGDEILQGSYASKNTEYNNSYCIAGDQAYTFEITDTYGDGICCGYGEGNYALFVDRIEVFTSGGAFGSSEVTQVNGDCTAPSSSPSIGTIETSVPSSSSGKPSLSPSSSPSLEKSSLPSNSPSSGPSDIPPMISNSDKPSLSPSSVPSEAPSDFSSDKPSSNPSSGPSEAQLITQIFVDQPDVEYGGSASLINCLGTNTTMIRKLEDTGYVTFTVDLQCLDVEVEVSYVSANNRNMHVFVNDNVDQSFVFNDTGEWCNQGGTSSSIMLPDLSGLKVGLNTFTFQNPSGTPPPVLEWIKFKEGCSFNSESPSEAPSILPSVKTMIPSNYPTEVPTGVPSIVPSLLPSSSVSIQPSSEPSWTPSLSSEPSTISSKSPSSLPSSEPSMVASNTPSSLPSTVPSINPSEKISDAPSNVPISEPSLGPSSFWSSNPSLLPSLEPSSLPSESSESPSELPSLRKSDMPTTSPTTTILPTNAPSLIPSSAPSESFAPTLSPTTELFGTTCIDDESYEFTLSNGNTVDCTWFLHYNPLIAFRRNIYCNGNTLFRCKKSCGRCSTDELPLDDEDYQFMVDGELKKCSWFSYNSNSDMYNVLSRQKSYCQQSYNGFLIADKCKLSCYEAATLPKKGLLMNKNVAEKGADHFGGFVSWYANYKQEPFERTFHREFIDRHGIEYVPMFAQNWLDHPDGTKRCFYEDYDVNGYVLQRNDNFPICTQHDAITILQESKAKSSPNSIPIMYVMGWNEQYINPSTLMTPQHMAYYYGKYLQPAAEASGLKIVSPTLNVGSVAWFAEFLDHCYQAKDDVQNPCDIFSMEKFAIHTYDCRYDLWTNWYDGNGSRLFTNLVNQLKTRLGNVENWENYVLARPLWIHETSCLNERTSPSFNSDNSYETPKANAKEQCERITGQSKSLHGDGSLVAMENISTIERYAWWTTYHNKLKPHYLTYKDGTITQVGEAYKRIGDSSVNCEYPGTKIFADDNSVVITSPATLLDCQVTNTNMVTEMKLGGSATYTVNVPLDGDYAINISYISAEPRNLQVKVNKNAVDPNDVFAKTFNFYSTGDNSWCEGGTGSTHVVPLELRKFKAGSNTITFGNDGDEDSPVIEWIALVPKQD